MIARIDRYLLARCTRFSHYFQRLTGRTNFFLAKLGVGMCFADVAINILNYYRPFLNMRTSLLEVVIGFTLTIGMTHRMICLDKMDQQALSGKALIKDPLFINWESRSGRVFWFVAGMIQVIYGMALLLQSLTLIPDVLGASFGIGMAIFVYFSAVIPLPPGKSRVREFFENFGILSKPAEAQT